MTTNDLQVEYRPFPKLTKEFIAARIELGWKDLAWVASNHWFDARVLAEIADELAQRNDDLRVELAIATAESDSAALKALIDRQAIRDVTTDEDIRQRWMRIAVAWLYENRELFDNPWSVIEEIWEAFGHPPALNGLIRWMPVPPGSKLGEEGMLERWRELATFSRSDV